MLFLLMRRYLLLLLFLAVGCRSTRPVQPSLSPAVFSPDGTAIVFSVAHGKDCFLYKADIASGTMQRMTKASDGCESDPAFSPDGRQLAFTYASENGGHAAVMLANSDDSGARVLVPADHDNLDPAFVPHSGQILFVRSAAFEHHSPLVDNRRHKFDLFAVNASTGAVAQLTDQKFYELSHLSVSADGKHAMITVSTYSEGDQFQIFTMNDSSATPQHLQPHVLPDERSSSPVLYNGVWMPDGKSILFQAAKTPPGGGNFDYNIYRFTLASKQIEQLTNLKGMLDGFSVSADGKRVVLLHRGDFLVFDLKSLQSRKVHLQWR
jgi:Tol biopolymer transport system component